MDLNKFTEKAQEAVVESQRLARQYSHSQIEPEHVLLALLRQEGGVVPTVVQKLGPDPRQIALRLEGELGRKPRVSGDVSQASLSREAAAALDQAEGEAAAMRDDYVSTEHILLGLLQSGANAARMLQAYGLSKDAVLRALAAVRGSQRVTSQQPESTYNALERYGRDLTQLARQNKLDPVIGRDEEIRRVIQILSRRTKNNPALVGDPGVGKTAIAE
ncbi:MAG: ATP-dependent chaperone ClpB, partial [Thermoflexales bacterium]|nr:ATP-dependent chaperone ClpB [Thermoflexales bacterium]